MTRETLYHWRNENADFDSAWDAAVATAADRIEEVLYQISMSGDIQAIPIG